MNFLLKKAKQDLSGDDLRRWLVTLWIAIAACGVSGAFLIVYLLFGQMLLAATCLVAIVIMVALIVLGYFGYYEPAKIYCLIAMNAMVLTAHILSPGIHVNFFFCATGVVPLVLFSVQRKTQIALAVSCATLFAILSVIFNPQLDPAILHQEFVHIINNILIPAVVALTCLPSFLLYTMTDEHFVSLKAKKADEIHASRMQALGQMASGIAHEINNPLAIVRGKAEQLTMAVNMGKATPEKITQLASGIIKNADRIRDIINGLRRFSRKSDKDPFTKVNLKEMVQASLELCRDRLAEIDITTEIASEHCVMGRDSYLMQVVVNLITNAADATDSARQDKLIATGTITITSRQKGPQIILEVTDNGAGINPSQLHQIFEPFHTSKPPGKGTGLGLSISKGIMQEHGGDISVISNRGRTIFRLTFPRPSGHDLSNKSA